MPKPKEDFNGQYTGSRPNEMGLTKYEIVEKRISEWKIVSKDFRKSEGSLNLSGLNLESLPEIIRQLKNVKSINISNNKISEIPKWIGELKDLTALDASTNQLKALPRQMGALKNLELIFLQNNDLYYLPEWLSKLPLINIRLQGNFRLELPSSILRLTPPEILRYYFESRSDDGLPLLELKLLLVGRGKAGKTTLVKRLSGEIPDEHESETHSISIRELTFKCPDGMVRTRAWDFGGQEILHSTHQFFLTERSLYLVVLEPRTGLAQRDAEYWLKLIESQGNGSPVIVALNWSHNHKWTVDRVKLERKFPFIVGFIPVDALNNYGIFELQKLIIQTVQIKMPDVWLPFPKHWRQIKDAVAGMKSNFLSFEQYAELCEQFGENRTDAQADLAGILHALGLALYFGKDPRLHDTRVLNPGWVTGGVYAVIRSRYVEDNDGQLSLSDMLKVLTEAQELKVIEVNDYPFETHRFILELMRAFQLCYASEEVNGKPSRYLVPELLPEFEPEMGEAWNQAQVCLRYHYTVLPPGLISRFIVQTHALSEGASHWRHGVVLNHADAKALIRDEIESSDLQVFILGENDDTRGLLVAIVRRELALLHKAMKIQPVEELELTGDGEQWISVKSLREVEEQDKVTQKLPVQPEGTAEVNVPLELDKLIPAAARAIDRDNSVQPEPVRLFVSYAHGDERQLKRLDAILDVLEQQHGLSSWNDKRLIAGDEWDEEIRARLEDMDIFLFIASQTSLVSPYIRDTEIKRALERRDLKEVEIVTVKLEPCACDDDAKLGKMQRLASKIKSVAEVSPKSIAWEQVRKDLLPVIKKIRGVCKINCVMPSQASAPWGRSLTGHDCYIKSNIILPGNQMASF
ncbi:COR domain-containing protein, partial [Mucilaginibacter sp.]|uniref:COR domain-containing protein n=1 Tax=Mucilaginibacter sp. TaxID=1882438 RepID=UPI003266F76F